MARGETYEEFTAKFEPKRTTDDCYTPPEVYDCVLRWAHREYEYPDEVLTAPMLARYSKYGIDFRVGPQECSFTRALDAQRVQNKAIYGSGYLISERAAAERFALSPRERDVIASLG